MVWDFSTCSTDSRVVAFGSWLVGLELWLATCTDDGGRRLSSPTGPSKLPMVKQPTVFLVVVKCIAASTALHCTVRMRTTSNAIPNADVQTKDLTCVRADQENYPIGQPTNFHARQSVLRGCFHLPLRDVRRMPTSKADGANQDVECRLVDRVGRDTSLRESLRSYAWRVHLLGIRIISILLQLSGSNSAATHKVFGCHPKPSTCLAQQSMLLGSDLCFKKTTSSYLP
eukprot:Sro3224_g345561.5  (228) ;mRNA; f:3905-4675